MNYKILDHTADIKAEIYGVDYNDLFKSAHLLWLNIVSDIKTIKLCNSKEIFTLCEENIEYLLVEFLKELNYYLAVRKKLLVNPEISINLMDKTYNLNCLANSIDIYNKDILIKEEIKAITLHNLSIKKVNNNYVATIIMDL